MEWITTTQALEDLKISNDSVVWNKFTESFRPVVINFAKKLGLSNDDAEDAAQETMLVFVKAFRDGKYNREKGRLRDWLFGVARRVSLNLRKNKPLEQLIADKSTGTSYWDLIEDDRNIKLLWEDQWRQMVLSSCLEQVKKEFDSKIFKAFELYAIEQTAIDEVARKLDMSRNAVYIAKSRVLSRMRQLEQQFE